MKMFLPLSGTKLMLMHRTNLPIPMLKENREFLRSVDGRQMTEGDTLMVPFAGGYILQVICYSVGYQLGDMIRLKCENELTFAMPLSKFDVDFEIRDTKVKQYYLQNRYQDSGWENLGLEYDELADALYDAATYAKDSIRYGMVRVVRRAYDSSLPGGIVLEIPAGGYPCSQ